MYCLSLGRVCYSAIVMVDDSKFKLAFAPYCLRLPLTAGKHTITVSVLNTDVNVKLGSAEAEKYTMETDNQQRRRRYENTRYTNDRRYVTSGLLGPVTVTRCKR